MSLAQQLVNLISVSFAISLCLSVILFFLLRSLNKINKKKREIQEKTIRYFYWNEKKKCLEIYSEFRDMLISVTSDDKYQCMFRQVSGNPDIVSVRFVLKENPHLINIFHISIIDRFSFESFARILGMKKI